MNFKPIRTHRWLLAGVLLALALVAAVRIEWPAIHGWIESDSSRTIATAVPNKPPPPTRGSTAGPLSTTSSAKDGVHGVFIEPQDGVAPVTNEIDAAKKSVDVEVYLITSDEIIASLKRAKGRNVTVRIIIERQPYKSDVDKSVTKSQLEANGFQVRFGLSRYTYTHAKFMIVDQKIGIVSTANFTYSAFSSNRDLGVTTTVAIEVAELQQVFNADWRDQPTPTVTSLVLSPTNSRDLMMSLVDGAKKRIDVYAEEMYDIKLVRAYIAAQGRGVVVRILVPTSTDPDQVAKIGQLTAAGVDVRVLDSPKLHAKMVLVDDERVFVGSQNMSANSIENNREVGLILTEQANISRLAKAFQRDFTSAQPTARVSSVVGWAGFSQAT